MSLVSLSNISKSYGTDLVLKDVSWQIEEGRKMGLPYRRTMKRSNVEVLYLIIL